MLEEKKFYLTKEGLERIKKEYRELKNLRLIKSKGEIPRIWESENLNSEYLSFQEDISFLESRIAELDYIFKNTELIKIPSREKQNIVNLGATVTLEDSDGTINEFMIVGTLEANPTAGKISVESPVGKVLLGRKIGDEITITSPIRVRYRVKKIRYQFN